MTRCAFFDFDGTMRAHDSIVDYVLYALKKGALRPWAFLRTAAELLGNAAARKAKPEELKTRAMRFEQAMTPERRGAFRRAFVQEKLLPKLRPEARRVWEQCRREGYRTVLVSASTENYMTLLGEALGADAVLCTPMTEDGTVHDNCRGEEKVRRILKWAETRPDADLARSGAWGDSGGDIPMLRLVGGPVAVNPDKKLLAAARKEGFRIVKW